MRSTVAALTLAAAALAGCQATAPAGGTPGPQASGPSGAATPNMVVARAHPDGPSTGDTADLQDLDETALRRLFGTPALSRREGQALILAYRFDDCVLHLFLYPRAGDAEGDPRVRHTAAIGADRRTRDAATCRP